MDFPYQKGCVCAMPLRMTETTKNEDYWEDDYLLPREALEMQSAVAQACDRMEYAGSPMYDQYPDKVTVERITDRICGRRQKNSLFRAMVQMMLCREMEHRRKKIKFTS